MGLYGTCALFIFLIWNSFPADLRSTLISRPQFRDGLKSHLFADAYF